MIDTRTQRRDPYPSHRGLREKFLAAIYLVKSSARFILINELIPPMAKTNKKQTNRQTKNSLIGE